MPAVDAHKAHRMVLEFLHGSVIAVRFSTAILVISNPDENQQFNNHEKASMVVVWKSGQSSSSPSSVSCRNMLLLAVQFSANEWPDARLFTSGLKPHCICHSLAWQLLVFHVGSCIWQRCSMRDAFACAFHLQDVMYMCAVVQRDCGAPQLAADPPGIPM